MKFQKIVGLTSCIVMSGVSQLVAQSFDGKTAALTSAPTDFVASVSWTQETWRDSDASFSGIDKQVQSQLSKKSAASLLTTYRAVALKDISDAKAVYRWALVARLVARNARTLQERRESTRLISDVYATMLRPAEPGLYRFESYYRHARPIPDSPHSYRYTRLLYLVSVGNGIPSVANQKQFSSLCTRLIRRNPADLTVKLARIMMLEHLSPVFKDGNTQPTLQSSTQIKQSRLKALQFAKQLKLEYPKSLPVLIRLADVYYWLWDGKNGYDKFSLDAYNDYLKLAPLSDKNYSDVKVSIIHIQELQKSFAQRKRQ